MTQDKKSNRNIGHRHRLRQRILDHGVETLADYEVLEALLFYVFKQGDTKPLAKDLLKEFGSLRQVCFADESELMKIKGSGQGVATFLKVIQNLNERITHESAFKHKPLLQSWDAVILYCRQAIGHKQTENFMVLYLNSANRLIKSETLHEGTVNRVSVYPLQIVTNALQHQAVSVILVHNHPSDNTTPSRQDIEMTKAIVSALRTVEISVHDHIIIGPNSHNSFKQIGLL